MRATNWTARALFATVLIQVIGLPGDPSPASVAFSRVIIDPAPPSGSGCCLDVVAVGDIDGDGREDIMVGSQFSVGVVWYHYPSWARYLIGSGEFTTDGEIADIDGDGDGDVLISTISRVEWWENTGNPFSPSGWAQHVIGGGYAHDLAVGDINGDGRMDVVSYASGQLTWFEAPADPRGTWVARSMGTPPGEGLAVGDIDRDGALDIAAGRRWFRNVNGNGLTWTTTTVTSAWDEQCRTILADMNGDGRLDVVLSHSEGTGRVSWFENPDWVEHAIEPSTLDGAHSLEVGDLDGDGDPDVFVGEMHTSSAKRVLVYENLAGGLSWSKKTLATTGTHNARIGDVGGDGDLDIVGKNYEGPKVVEMWENQTGGVTPPAAPSALQVR